MTTTTTATTPALRALSGGRLTEQSVMRAIGEQARALDAHVALGQAKDAVDRYAATRGADATARPQPSAAEVLAAVKQVSAYAAKITARAMARRRRDEVREIAAALGRIAAGVDRLQLTGAEQLRTAAQRYGQVAETITESLRTR